jgi:hypothetical protein
MHPAPRDFFSASSSRPGQTEHAAQRTHEQQHECVERRSESVRPDLYERRSESSKAASGCKLGTGHRPISTDGAERIP